MGPIAHLTSRFRQQGCIDRSGALPVLRIPVELKDSLDAKVKIAKEQPTTRKIEFSTAEIEDLVDTLGVGEVLDKWSYLDEHAFKTIVLILSLAPPCLARDQGLYSLADALEGSGEPADAKPEAFRSLVGEALIPRLIAFFLDDKQYPVTRRWVGLLLAELMDSPVNRTSFMTLSQKFLTGMGQVIVEGVDRTLKIVAGKFVRKFETSSLPALMSGSASQLAHLYEAKKFPVGAGSQWDTDFSEYISDLETILSDSMMPTAAGFQATAVRLGRLSFSKIGNIMCSITMEFVTIYIAPDIWLDVATENIENISISENKKLPTVVELAIELYDFRESGQIYLLSMNPGSEHDVIVIRVYEAEAEDIANEIKDKRDQRRLKLSGSQPSSQLQVGSPLEDINISSFRGSISAPISDIKISSYQDLSEFQTQQRKDLEPYVGSSQSQELIPVVEPRLDFGERTQTFANEVEDIQVPNSQPYASKTAFNMQRDASPDEEVEANLTETTCVEPITFSESRPSGPDHSSKDMLAPATLTKMTVKTTIKEQLEGSVVTLSKERSKRKRVTEETTPSPPVPLLATEALAKNPTTKHSFEVLKLEKPTEVQSFSKPTEKLSSHREMDIYDLENDDDEEGGAEDPRTVKKSRGKGKSRGSTRKTPAARPKKGVTNKTLASKTPVLQTKSASRSKATETDNEELNEAIEPTRQPKPSKKQAPSMLPSKRKIADSTDDDDDEYQGNGQVPGSNTRRSVRIMQLKTTEATPKPSPKSTTKKNTSKKSLATKKALPKPGFPKNVKRTVPQKKVAKSTGAPRFSLKTPNTQTSSESDSSDINAAFVAPEDTGIKSVSMESPTEPAQRVTEKVAKPKGSELATSRGLEETSSKLLAATPGRNGKKLLLQTPGNKSIKAIPTTPFQNPEEPVDESLVRKTQVITWQKNGPANQGQFLKPDNQELNDSSPVALVRSMASVPPDENEKRGTGSSFQLIPAAFVGDADEDPFGCPFVAQNSDSVGLGSSVLNTGFVRAGTGDEDQVIIGQKSPFQIPKAARKSTVSLNVKPTAFTDSGEQQVDSYGSPIQKNQNTQGSFMENFELTATISQRAIKERLVEMEADAKAAAAAAIKAEADRLAKETTLEIQKEQERLAKEFAKRVLAEKERLGKENAEKLSAEESRLTKEAQDALQVQKDRLDQEAAARIHAEKGRLEEVVNARSKAEKEKQAKLEAHAKAEADRLSREADAKITAEKERLAKETAARIEAAKRKLKDEYAANERANREDLERQFIEMKAEQDRIAKEAEEKAQANKERFEREVAIQIQKVKDDLEKDAAIRLQAETERLKGEAAEAKATEERLAKEAAEARRVLREVAELKLREEELARQAAEKLRLACEARAKEEELARKAVERRLASEAAELKLREEELARQAAEKLRLACEAKAREEELARKAVERRLVKEAADTKAKEGELTVQTPKGWCLIDEKEPNEQKTQEREHIARQGKEVTLTGKVAKEVEILEQEADSKAIDRATPVATVTRKTKHMRSGASPDVIILEDSDDADVESTVTKPEVIMEKHTMSTVESVLGLNSLANKPQLSHFLETLRAKGIRPEQGADSEDDENEQDNNAEEDPDKTLVNCDDENDSENTSDDDGSSSSSDGTSSESAIDPEDVWRAGLPDYHKETLTVLDKITKGLITYLMDSEECATSVIKGFEDKADVIIDTFKNEHLKEHELFEELTVKAKSKIVAVSKSADLKLNAKVEGYQNAVQLARAKEIMEFEHRNLTGKIADLMVDLGKEKTI